MIQDRVYQLVADLRAIDFYDRTMYDAGICDECVLTNMVVQDKLLQELERLDADAYLAYICGEDETLDKYYTKREAIQ